MRSYNRVVRDFMAAASVGRELDRLGSGVGVTPDAMVGRKTVGFGGGGAVCVVPPDIVLSTYRDRPISAWSSLESMAKAIAAQVIARGHEVHLMGAEVHIIEAGETKPFCVLNCTYKASAARVFWLCRGAQ